MSVQRAEVHWARYLDGNRRVVLEADHARIVAEATAEARAAERRHWEARFRNAEQAHAAALADVRVPAWQNGYDAGYKQARGDAEVRRVVEVAAAAATEHYEREAGR